MKAFAMIEFKRKWIMPSCSPTHLALEWSWTLIAQINLRLSNRLVNINHLNLPRQKFWTLFAPAKTSMSHFRFIILSGGHKAEPSSRRKRFFPFFTFFLFSRM
jgi:hypothetical protein